MEMIGEVLLGRYRVDTWMCEAASGSVWRGTDLESEAAVELKLARERDEAEHALLEGEAMAAIVHPGVLRLLDFGLHNERHPCLVMEVAEGEPLGERLRQAGPLPWTDAFSLGLRVLEGLMAMHAEGLLHCDINPTHVVVSGDAEDRVKLVGLDRVRLVSDDSPVVARPADRPPEYMAPEQLTSSSLGPATDIYALGLVLWESISGTSAFAGQPNNLAARIAFRPDFDALPAQRSPLPAAARTAFEQMLRPSLWNRDPDARTTARRFRAALGIDPLVRAAS